MIENLLLGCMLALILILCYKVDKLEKKLDSKEKK